MIEAKADEFLEGLMSRQALEEPSDSCASSELVLELPPWYDENKYKLGQKFYWDNLFGALNSMLTGLLAVLAIPSILAVLVHTRRSSSVYTSYKRYISTVLHTVAWHKHPLQPGSVSWKSLYAVRSRHLRAGRSAKSSGLTHISQRDLALTQFGFMGFAMIKADELGLAAVDIDAWEGLNHFWRTIGHMIGLKDKYNICSGSVEQTRVLCKALQQRVFSPCLENVPEPFEYMAKVLLDSVWPLSPKVEVKSMLYFTRYLANVPGYVYTEQERISFRTQLKQKLKDMPESTELESRHVLFDKLIDGLPNRPPKIYRPDDYILLETVPEYKQLPPHSKDNLTRLIYMHRFLYTTRLVRWFLNWTMVVSLWLIEHFPFLAFPLYGYRASFVDLFTEGPKDDAVPKSNAEMLKDDVEKPWYALAWGWKL